MPWHTVRNHSQCPSDKPWAVVKDNGGTVAGCHASEDDANSQMAALYASEADQEDLMTVIEMGGKPNPGTAPDKRLAENKTKKRKRVVVTYAKKKADDCPEGQHMMPNGECMDDDEMMMDTADIESFDDLSEVDVPTGPYRKWSGVLAVEGVETGDGREFAPGSIEWPDLEDVVVPIMWQEASEPQHGHSIVVGRIEKLERVGNEILGEGIIAADAKVTAQLEHGVAGGVSVDVDSVKDADVELVFPQSDPDKVQRTDDGKDDIVMLFGPPPEKVIFHRGRLRGATLVALPAFVEARIKLVDNEADAVVASGIPVDPPASWFKNPEFDGPTPWHVEDSGQVFGHLCLWASCHQTFPDRCVTPPRERDFPYFMRSELHTADGPVVGVGPITMGTGHASTRLGARPAAAHYDNTGTAVVDVSVGQDRYGVWVAGALRSTVTEIQLRELRGAALSGDWRRIGGQLRLVAILAVNVPGFPIPKMRARVDDDWSSMVAAGIVTETDAERIRSTLRAMITADGTIRVRRVHLAAVGTHDTATKDGVWDGAANEKRLPSPMSAGQARDYYAWLAPGAGGEVQKSDGKFGHHFVDANGNPGAASVVACSSGIAVLNGGRGGTTIPAADRQGVYNHLAAHLRDAGREPPPLA